MSDRVLRNTSATLGVVFDAGEAVVEADGDVTVTITDAAGAVVATDVVADHTDGEDTYSHVLAPQAMPNLLTAVWTGTFSGQVQAITTEVEIVGRFFFTLRQLRAQHGIGDETTFTTADLASARTRAENYIERRVGAALVERYGSETIAAAGSWLPVAPFVRQVLALTVGDTTFSAEEIAELDIEDWGAITQRSGLSFGPGRVTVSYLHCWSVAPPEELAKAALIRARHDLLGWTADQPAHPVEVAELGTTDPDAANAERAAGRTEIEATIKSWRALISGPVFA